MSRPSPNASGGRMMPVELAAELIRSGNSYSIAGDESQLRQLPAGNWIGGTIPYFLGQDGGQTTQQGVFVAPLPSSGLLPQVKSYDESTLDQICLDGPDHGFSIIVIPAFSGVHTSFARNAPSYDDMYVKPLIGWISGIHLEQMDKQIPMAVNGQTLAFEREKVVVMHMPLPPHLVAHIDILNLFEQGKGPLLQFNNTGFHIDQCSVDGKPMRLSDFVKSNQIDTRLPLVADYCGAMVNASIKSLNDDGTVDMYAPLFEGVDYRFAAPWPTTWPPSTSACRMTKSP
nr:hypothetical protein [Diaphorobacter aerolatus]